MTAIGIDIGSTTIKGALLEPGGNLSKVIEKQPFPEPVIGLNTSHFEIDPLGVYRAVLKVIRQLLVHSPQANRLYLCGQMGGAMLCDRNGCPVSRYISWRDQRFFQKDKSGKQLIESVRDMLGNETLAELGQELKSGSTSVLLHTLVKSQNASEGMYPATIADGVAAYLCRKPPKTHPTMAIGMLDLKFSNPVWHRGLIDSLQLNHLEWLDLAEIDKPYGIANIDGVTLEVFPAVGDQQAALLGAGLVPGELSLNVSTGAQVSCIVDRMTVGQHQTRHFFNSQLLNTITHIPAGRSLHSIVDILTELSRVQGLPIGDPWNTLVRLMNEIEFNPTDHKLEVGLSFYSSPVGENGYISGITLENFSIGRIMVAATRNLAENLLKCSEMLSTRRNWSRVRLSGGLAQTLPHLTRYIGHYFGSDVLVESASIEETLSGLAILAYGRDPKYSCGDSES